RPLLGVDAREAGFIFLLYLLGPILLVNGVLKTYWGRARPVDVAEFGGAATFTPPWLPADQCVANCSFVSGEGSAATALLLAFVVLAPDAWRLFPRRAFALYALAGLVLPATGLALRIMTGRHFLSDTIFAVLLVLSLALGLLRLLLKGRCGSRARVDNPRVSLYTARTRPRVYCAWAGIRTEVVTIRAPAPILWNSSASPPRRGRMRFWCFADAQGTQMSESPRERR